AAPVRPVGTGLAVGALPPQNPNLSDVIVARFDPSIPSRWAFPYPTRMIAAPPFWDLIPAQLGALPLAGDWNSLTSGSVTVMPLASFLSARGVLLVNQLTARRQL